MTSKELREKLVAEPFAWPGGYEIHGITDDGGLLCWHCAKNEAYCIDNAFPRDGWNLIVLDVNWENPELFCDHCSNQIPPAYGVEP